jgi:nucleotide-binding universal stress UspA family protein
MNDPIKKILVTTDGSPESESVFPAIMPIVRADDPEVSVLYVIEDPDASFMPPARLAKACGALRAANVRASLEIREGAPAEEILRAAREKKADLIAMSTHGRGGVVRLIAGSVAEEVLRRSKVPVLMTRPETPVHPWKRIAVALDGSERSEAILPEAAALAKKMGAVLEVLHVVHPVVAGGAGEIPVVLPPPDPMPYLDGVLKRLAAEGLPPQVAILEGGTSQAILRHLEASGAGLLCMTTHGRTGMTRILLGSVAEEILRKAPCPVLLRRNVPLSEEAPKAMNRDGAKVH